MAKFSRIICFPFVGDSIGGSQLASIILIKNLYKIKYGYKVLLFETGPLEKILRKEKINYEILKINANHTKGFFFKTFFLSIFYSFNLMPFLKLNNIDILHTNDIRMHYFWSVICKINKINHIWHQHSAYFSRRNIFFSSLSKRILTVSNFCKLSFTRKMNERAIIISNPFDEKCLVNKDEKISRNNFIRKKLNISIKTKIITYIGSINSQKRLSIFLNIILKLNKEKNCDYLFLIIGSFNKHENFLNRIKGLNYLLITNKYELRDFYIISNLVISPGVNEGFGRTLIESMMARTCILASNSGAHRELISDNQNGILSKKDSEKDFFDKTFYILSEKNNRFISKITDNAFDEVKKKFRLNDYLLSLDKIYNSLYE